MLETTLPTFWWVLYFALLVFAIICSVLPNYLLYQYVCIHGGYEADRIGRGRRPERLLDYNGPYSCYQDILLAIIFIILQFFLFGLALFLPPFLVGYAQNTFQLIYSMVLIFLIMVPMYIITISLRLASFPAHSQQVHLCAPSMVLLSLVLIYMVSVLSFTFVFIRPVYLAFGNLTDFSNATCSLTQNETSCYADLIFHPLPYYTSYVVALCALLLHGVFFYEMGPMHPDHSGVSAKSWLMYMITHFAFGWASYGYTAGGPLILNGYAAAVVMSLVMLTHLGHYNFQIYITLRHYGTRFAQLGDYSWAYVMVQQLFMVVACVGLKNYRLPLDWGYLAMLVLVLVLPQVMASLLCLLYLHKQTNPDYIEEFRRYMFIFGGVNVVAPIAVSFITFFHLTIDVTILSLLISDLLANTGVYFLFLKVHWYEAPANLNIYRELRYARVKWDETDLINDIEEYQRGEEDGVWFEDYDSVGNIRQSYGHHRRYGMTRKERNSFVWNYVYWKSPAVLTSWERVRLIYMATRDRRSIFSILVPGLKELILRFFKNDFRPPKVLEDWQVMLDDDERTPLVNR